MHVSAGRGVMNKLYSMNTATTIVENVNNNLHMSGPVSNLANDFVKDTESGSCTDISDVDDGNCKWRQAKRGKRRRTPTHTPLSRQSEGLMSDRDVASVGRFQMNSHLDQLS
jgi:hypothetical protein